MNGSTSFTISPILSFLVVGGLIVLAMAMSRRNQDSQRAGFGWWIGLGLLLLVVSGFLAVTRMRGGAVKEERHTGRYAFNQAIAEMKEGIASGAQAMQEGLDEASKSIEEVQKAMTSAKSGSKTSNKRTGNSASVTVGSVPAIPLSTLEWTVEVKGDECSQNQRQVASNLMEKAVASVNKWVNERMPIKSLWFRAIDENWLLEHNALPLPVKFETEGIPRLDSNEKDPLHGGTLKVVLSPATQQSLLEIGYKRLEELLLEDKFEGQAIIFFVLVVITGMALALGTVKTLYARRVSRA